MNEIVIERKILSPALILVELEKIFQKNLTSKKNNNSLGGMDIGICLWQQAERKIIFSGTKILLIKIHNQEISIWKGNAISIGNPLMLNNRNFTNDEICCQKDDIFYMMSDGYADQFGELSGKKYLTSNLRKFLFEIHHLPMQTQKQLLLENIKNWKGNHQQTDDILILGFRL